MLELTGVASLLRGASMLYWLLALAALFCAIKFPKKRWHKAATAGLVLGLFGYLPVSQFVVAKQREAFAKEAWAYFKKKCETESGQRVYRTVSGITSIRALNLLPSAIDADLSNQYWYGDPYTNATPGGADRGFIVASRLVSTSKLPDGSVQRGFESVEIERAMPGKTRFERVTYSVQTRRHIASEIDKPTSRFGVMWEDISTPEDRKYWVAGSRLRIVDLKDNSTVGERIGFLIEPRFGSRAGGRIPWLAGRGPNTTCPALVSLDYQDSWFVLRVLQPAVKEGRNGK